MPSPTQNSVRVPCLDGLRAFSVGLVVLAHFATQRGWMSFGPEPEPLRAVLNGSLGVSLFFGLSGFVITLKLLEEKIQTGKIRVGVFYIRRFFKIVPPLLFFLSAMGCLVFFGFVEGRPQDFLSTLSMSNNLLPGMRTWVLGHCWSLSVEEQFYLFWPWFISALTLRRARPILLVLIFASPWVRAAQGGGDWMHGVGQPFHHNPADLIWNRIDAFLWGALAAFQFVKRSASSTFKYDRLLQRLAVQFFGLVYLGVPLFRYWWIFNKDHPIYFSLESASIGILIYSLAIYPESYLGRVLNSKGWVKVGLASYSIYLWQQPFLGRNQIPQSALSLWERVPLNWIGVALMSVFSYCWIEGGSRKIRDRFLSGLGL